MDKNKKRHISKSKYDRVREKGRKALVVSNSGKVNAIYSMKGFLYWVEWERGYGFKYYRKAMKEALK